MYRFYTATHNIKHNYKNTDTDTKNGRLLIHQRISPQKHLHDVLISGLKCIIIVICTQKVKTLQSQKVSDITQQTARSSSDQGVSTGSWCLSIGCYPASAPGRRHLGHSSPCHVTSAGISHYINVSVRRSEVRNIVIKPYATPALPNAARDTTTTECGSTPSQCWASVCDAGPTLRRALF